MERPDIGHVANLAGDATRATILSVLMDGRAYTATELALECDVAPSTMSEHLGRLTSGGLISLVKQGRHRYFRIASVEIASVLEGLMGIAQKPAVLKNRVGPSSSKLRRSRVCYDHLAGEVAVNFLDRLKNAKIIQEEQGNLLLTDNGTSWCDRIHLDTAVWLSGKRPICRSCLDWSERLPHLGGAMGAAILDYLFRLKYAQREPYSRAVSLTPRGVRFLDQLG